MMPHICMSRGRKSHELGDVRYKTIVADPPWDYGDKASAGWSWRKGRPSGEVRPLPYPTMSLEEIAALPVRDLAAKGAHLYVWTTQRFLWESRWICEAWGFTPICTNVWCKEPRGFGPGGAFQSTVEFFIFARRGSLAALSTQNPQWYRWPRGDHSAKPDAFLDLVEQISPAPRLELFARRQRLGWDTWGNEALEHVEVAS